MSTELTRETIQRAVGEWGEQTFPHASPASIVVGLQCEVEELARAVESGTSFSAEEEMANCYLLLLHLAHRSDVDLVEAGAAKFIVNKQRTWDPPDADSVSGHD
ncbi:MAG TPA: dATP/dGTP pyrophosphohydrolase domain-containing protein [Gemmatimonadaceae bacterium]|nr:dATP/dGTP pyrophosphohydrolase domain-containing protein [Gemmatimonadaceae bacterium]